jgi:hypothetical protein
MKLWCLQNGCKIAQLDNLLVPGRSCVAELRLLLKMRNSQSGFSVTAQDA